MADEIWKIILTSALTVFGGVSVYVIGQLISKLLFEPTFELLKAVREVRFVLAFHAPTIHTPRDRDKSSSSEAESALKKCSSELMSRLHAVSAYDAMAQVLPGTFPSRTNIENAAVTLRGLSTHMHETGDRAENSLDAVNNRVEYIVRLLNLKPLD